MRKILLSTALCGVFAIATPALAAGGAGATASEGAQTAAPMNTESTTTVQPTAPSEATPADPTSDSPATAHRSRKSNMSNTSTTPDANAQAQPPMEHNQPQSTDDSSAMQKGSENNAATAPQSNPQ